MDNSLADIQRTYDAKVCHQYVDGVDEGIRYAFFKVYDINLWATPTVLSFEFAHRNTTISAWWNTCICKMHVLNLL